MSQRPKQRSAIAQRVFFSTLLCISLLIIGLVAIGWWIYDTLNATFGQTSTMLSTWTTLQTSVLEQAPLLGGLALGWLVVILLLARTLIDWALRPFSELAAAATTNDAQWSTHLPVQAAGEVGQIARNFSDLTVSFQRSLHELDEQNQAMNETVRRLEGVLRVGQELSATLDAGQLLRRVTATVRTTFGYEWAGAALVEDNALVFYVSGPTSDEAAPLVRTALTERSAAGRAARRGTLVRLDHTSGETQLVPSSGLPEVRTELAVPVVSGQQVVAVLLLQSSQPAAFSEQDEQQLTALSGLLAVALSNASHFQTEHLRRQFAEAMYRVSHLLSAALTSDRISELLLDQLAQVLPSDHSALLLLNGDQVVTTATRGAAHEHIVTEHHIALADVPLIAEIVAQGQPLMLADAQRELRYRPMPGTAPARSWLGAPLVRQGQVQGVLVLESGQPNRYGDEELRALTALANQAVIALENARLYAAMQERTQRLEVIAGITKLISSRDVYRDLHGILRAIIHMMRRVVPCDYAALALYHAEDDTFFVETVYDYAVRDWSQLAAGQRIPAAGTPWQTACRTNGPVTQSNLTQSGFQDDRRLIANNLASSVVVPIIGANQAFGALHFASRTPNAYGDAQIATLMELSLYLGPVLHNARLSQAGEETAVRLAKTEEHLNLVNKVRTVGQLASGVAHDFNNLLGGILGNAQLLLLDITEGEQQDMLKVIERAAKDGTETVRRLQGFARMEHDSPMIEVRLDMLARDAIDITRPRWRDVAQQRGATIEIARNLQPVTPIAGRPAELREVLTNLIINAVDAMPDGGVLTLTTYNESMIGDESGKVVIEIADTGIGMPADVRAHIFDPFYTTKGEQGTGIGLAVSLGIVQSHGGDISVESTVGRGTSFTVRLPVRAAATAQQEQRRNMPITPGHILFVESEAMIRAATVRLLTHWGHTVTEAAGGIEALQLFKPGIFNVVISDLGMPDMSGWDLLAQIKQHQHNIPTVLMTGWGNQQNDEEAQARGADFVIEKPFDQDDLRTVLAEAMQRR